MSIGSRIEDPLYRCFNREIDAAASLLDLIRSNLQEAISACRGDIKLSNLSRDCIESVQRGKSEQFSWVILWSLLCLPSISISVFRTFSLS